MIWVHVNGLISNDRTPHQVGAETRVRFMSTSAWERHKDVLAQKSVLTDDEWIGLEAAFHSAETLRAFIFEQPANSPLPGDIV